MTDEQIIIDDYFTECTDEGGGTIGYYLISDTALIKKIREQNAYIKAKEQECEELKKEAVNLKLNLKKVINLSQKKNRQCYQFLADIKQLKRQHQGDKGLITTTEKMNYQLIQEYDKLKTVLTEIKEIAEKRNYLDYNECLDDILQKISECEVIDA